MFQSLTLPSPIENVRARIAEIFDAHAEWFCVSDEGASLALRRFEIDVAVRHGRLILSYWTEKGTRSWRVLSCDSNESCLTFKASRKMGALVSVIEFIPRASALAVAASISAAREVRCRQLAQLAAGLASGLKIERVALSPGIRRGQPGRFARILLHQLHRRVAVTGSVITSHPGDVDAFLSSALLWFARTSNRIHPPLVQQLWLVVEADLVRPAIQRIVLFRPGLKEIINLFTIDATWTTLQHVPLPERESLFRKRLPKFPPVSNPALSVTAKEIIDVAPDRIDVVHAKHGESLRYFGLPFARVREVLGHEHVWFGLEGSQRRLLDHTSFNEWNNLLSDLALHRAADAPDHHHGLYRAASEAWLESMLRRDITRLDPGLIIAPLYAQFRTARGGSFGLRPIDLLALRQDGRLVVIELKVYEDREHVLQGADYWQRVEAHRRRGHISKARLFGDRKIRDEASLVYLVAPTLRVHPSMQILARCIARDIEIYRFDINEDWRRGVRVMRRLRIN
jgi:hypothetical protein